MIGPLKDELGSSIVDSIIPVFRDDGLGFWTKAKDAFDSWLARLKDKYRETVVANVIHSTSSRLHLALAKIHTKSIEEVKAQLSKFSIEQSEIMNDVLREYFAGAPTRTENARRFRYLAEHCSDAARKIGEEVILKLKKIFVTMFNKFGSDVKAAIHNAAVTLKRYNKRNWEEVHDLGLAGISRNHAFVVAWIAKHMLERGLNWRDGIMEPTDREKTSFLDQKMDLICSWPEPWSLVSGTEGAPIEAGPSHSRSGPILEEDDEEEAEQEPVPGPSWHIGGPSDEDAELAPSTHDSAQPGPSQRRVLYPDPSQNGPSQPGPSRRGDSAQAGPFLEREPLPGPSRTDSTQSGSSHNGRSNKRPRSPSAAQDSPQTSRRPADVEVQWRCSNPNCPRPHGRKATKLLCHVCRMYERRHPGQMRPNMPIRITNRWSRPTG